MTTPVFGDIRRDANTLKRDIFARSPFGLALVGSITTHLDGARAHRYEIRLVWRPVSIVFFVSDFSSSGAARARAQKRVAAELLMMQDAAESVGAFFVGLAALEWPAEAPTASTAPHLARSVVGSYLESDWGYRTSAPVFVKLEKSHLIGEVEVDRLDGDHNCGFVHFSGRKALDGIQIVISRKANQTFTDIYEKAMREVDVAAWARIQAARAVAGFLQHNKPPAPLDVIGTEKRISATIQSLSSAMGKVQRAAAKFGASTRGAARAFEPLTVKPNVQWFLTAKGAPAPIAGTWLAACDGQVVAQIVKTTVGDSSVFAANVFGVEDGQQSFWSDEGGLSEISAHARAVDWCEALIGTTAHLQDGDESPLPAYTVHRSARDAGARPVSYFLDRSDVVVAVIVPTAVGHTAQLIFPDGIKSRLFNGAVEPSGPAAFSWVCQSLAARA